MALFQLEPFTIFVNRIRTGSYFVWTGIGYVVMGGK